VEDSILLNINPLVLLIGTLCVSGAGAISAVVFSGTHDIKKSIYLYLPISVVISTVLVILGIPVIIGIGLIGFGLIILVYTSNRLFYK
jgi:hypothetical protein